MDKKIETLLSERDKILQKIHEQENELKDSYNHLNDINFEIDKIQRTLDSNKDSTPFFQDNDEKCLYSRLYSLIDERKITLESIKHYDTYIDSLIQRELTLSQTLNDFVVLN